MADAEAAFLSAMQATNDSAGNYMQSGEASEQQAESASSDEYDPSQAMQPEISHTHAPESVAQTSSHDPSLSIVSSSASTMPLTSTSASTNPIPEDNHDYQSQSRSMSRDSSQSSETTPFTNSLDQASKAPTNSKEGGDVKQLDGNGALDMNEPSSLAPVSSPHLNASSSHVSANNVPIQNNVQEKSTSNVIQNGANDSISNVAAVISDAKASPHTDLASKSSEIPQAPPVSEKTLPKQQPTTPTISAPKARLPHDRIGLLEDRIKDDPRGDLDAWLSLIEEHKKRAKLDDARNVYERFFSIFPFAVCLIQCRS